MDLAKQLVRSCARSFYSQPPFDVRHVLIIDALAIHGALRDDDLGYLLSIPAMKDLHKLCARLKDERFLDIHVRPELKEGAVRPSNRIYYFIDYRQTIDAIKWRVYKLGKDMQVPSIPASERKEYVCPRCKADYTQLEVLNMITEHGFACERCSSILNHELDRTSAGQEKVTRLNNQLKFVTDLLFRIDSVVVPDNDFHNAIQTALPVVRDEQHQVAAATVVDPIKPTSVKGLADTGPKKIDIKISTSDGPTDEEKEAERLRKEKVAKQNALPVWMASSTVNGGSFLGKTPTGDSFLQAEPEKKVDDKQQMIDAQQALQLKQHMEEMKREQEELAAAAALKKQEEGSDDEDEDEEDDFEDVVPTPSATSFIGTPVPASQGLKPAPSPLRQSSVPIKSEPAVNGNGNGNGNDNGNGISALKRDSPCDDDRPAKKIKVEDPADDDDDDEEIEFEDV
ncbi:unnamed protein product [Discula destructiva]